VKRALSLSLALSLALLAGAACRKDEGPPPRTDKPVEAEPAPARTYGALDRGELNRWAVRENVPLYWIADTDGDKQVDPYEVAALLFYPTKGEWVAGGAFTPAFDAAYDALVAASKAPPPAGAPEEQKRRELVGKDLDQGRATLVLTQTEGWSAEEKQFLARMLEIADLVDALYRAQTGAAALAGQVPADDKASQSLFRRNQGPACVAPATEKEAACSAIPGAPKKLVDVYPAALQAAATFCQDLDKRPDAKALLTPFTAVRAGGESGEALTPVPYPEAYPQMKDIADRLDAAAAGLADPAEAPLVAYLKAAAASFRSNDWQPADEAWSKMNAENSKWYVRVGPDEVYWEPCARKAGFHLSFARIDQGSLVWQKKLAPLQQEMEAGIAKAAGAPYKARTVTFHLPDFIDIVANAGDSREALGATIGQSLPNWGPVAMEGRGRTVAMSNLYTDPDTLATRRAQVESLFDGATAALYPTTPEAGLLSTILHEATHNLGPHAEYKVKGKTDDEAFGGPIASAFEELKAQTGALFLVELLRSKGVIDDAMATATYVDSIAWTFSHIASGMYTATGERKAYSHVAAIQVGFLIDQGALRWDEAATAANGKDKGALVLDRTKLVPAIDAMMKAVGGIKARGDRKAAEALIAKYVDGIVVPHAAITERMGRYPKVNFVYAVQ
jgi:hypothetical protein